MRLFRTTYDMSIDINEFITRIVLNGKLIVEEPNVVEIINGNYCAVGKRALCMTKPPIQFEITKPIHNAAICKQEAFEFLFWDPSKRFSELETCVTTYLIVQFFIWLYVYHSIQ